MTGISHGQADFGNPPASPYDVQFQPETGILLDLLGSEAVYGSPMMAVPELVLNAFDAILKRVAIQRLALPAGEDAADPEWQQNFQKEDQVILEMFGNENGRFLRCHDTGIGLDAELIAQRLLCPGKAPGPAWQALDGQCQARGFRMPGRMARGLGFLSYFMLAEAVKIRSLRYLPQVPGPESQVIFKSEGPRNRSLLRTRPVEKRGIFSTNVTLRLKAKATRSGSEFGRHLKPCLLKTVVRTPCPLNLLTDEEALLIPDGWSPATPVITPRVITCGPALLDLRRLTTTSATLDLITAITSIPMDHWSDAGISVGMDLKEYHVPGLATLRCTAPWIAYRGIRAMVWATDAFPDSPVGRNALVALTHRGRTAWRGMQCEITSADFPGKPTVLPGLPVGHPPSQLPPWAFLALDIDLDEPPVETLAVSRRHVTLTVETESRLKAFCLQSLHHMAGHVRRKHLGTLLAEQMEEVEGAWERKTGRSQGGSVW